MSKINKHGLSRAIPKEVKEAIRKNSYYGCIICGNALCDYEHIDPEFSDAQTHDPSKMCLLCPNHNQSKARGRFNKVVVLKHMLNPFCKNKPWNHKFENITDQHPQISIGGSNFIDSFNILTIDGEDILSIKPPESAESPFRINANFYDTNSSKIAVIEDNIIKSSEEIEDVEFKSNKITIKGKKCGVNLEIKEGDFSKFTIPSLDIRINEHRVFIYKDDLFYINKITFQLLIIVNSKFENANSAITINKGNLSLGRGGSLAIRKMSINPIDISKLPNLDNKNSNYIGKLIYKAMSSKYKLN